MKNFNIIVDDILKTSAEQEGLYYTSQQIRKLFDKLPLNIKKNFLEMLEFQDSSGKDLEQKIKQHFDNLKIPRSKHFDEKVLSEYLSLLHRRPWTSNMEKIIKDIVKLSKFLYDNSYEDRISLNELTKDELIDKTDFLDDKHFVRAKENKKYEWILWIDWMSQDQYAQVAKILGIKI